MELSRLLCLLLFITTMTLVSARKRRKDKKIKPKWKSNSDPFKKLRYVPGEEGKDLKMDCRAQGSPKPRVIWTRNGVPIMDSERMETRKFGLQLTNMTLDMIGNYTCMVENKHGEISWTFHLDVKPKIWPMQVMGPENQTTVVGSSVVFRCWVTNDPSATVSWQKYDKNLPEDEQQFIGNLEDPTLLTLHNVQKKDEGVYRCMVGNIHGLKYATATLTVIEPAITVPHETDDTKGLDPFLPDVLQPYNPNRGNSRPTDFGPDMYEATTRRPKNRNNRKKNGKKKKDRKNKEKKRKDGMSGVFAEDLTSPITTPSTASTTQSTTTTFPTIYRFKDDDLNKKEGDRDMRGYPGDNHRDHESETANSQGDEEVQGSISSWTIYTIVGAVGGVILLIGLIAITLTICCKKEDGGVYKSTPV